MFRCVWYVAHLSIKKNIDDNGNGDIGISIGDTITLNFGNGQPKEMIIRKSENIFLYRKFYSNGVISEESLYRDYLNDSITTQYYNNGVLSLKSSFSKGKRVGWSELFNYPDGELLERNFASDTLRVFHKIGANGQILESDTSWGRLKLEPHLDTLVIDRFINLNTKKL